MLKQMWVLYCTNSAGILKGKLKNVYNLFSHHAFQCSLLAANRGWKVKSDGGESPLIHFAASTPGIIFFRYQRTWGLIKASLWASAHSAAVIKKWREERRMHTGNNSTHHRRHHASCALVFIWNRLWRTNTFKRHTVMRSQRSYSKIRDGKNNEK